MKRRELDIFFELIKNSKKSDRDIAKKLNISQPTVTRVRKKLERTVIKAYTLVPSFSELGIELISFNFGMCDSPKRSMEACLRHMAKTNPQIIFTSSGEGMRKNCVILAIHRDYRDYVDFLTGVREQCKGINASFDTFLAPTTKDQNLEFANPVLHLMKKSPKKP